MNRLIAMGLLSVIMLPAVEAHHSRANFELDVFTELEGEIIDFSWRNPHAFATLLTTNDSGEQEEWLLELNSITVLTSMGWDRDTVQVGDRVRITGNRDLDYDKRFFFANVFEFEDGTRIVVDPIAVARAAGRRPPPPPPSASPASDAVATDVFGIWRQIGVTGGVAPGPGAPGPGAPGGGPFGGGGPPPDLLSGAVFGPSTSLPVTERGQAAIDAFDENDNPEFTCTAPTAPALVRRGNLRIERTGEGVRFVHELMDAERIVHLNEAQSPQDAEPSLHGHSVGRFEDGVLAVESTNFSDNPWGNGRGVPSGSQKRVVERYSLADGGRRLRLQYTQEDPEYLSGAVSGTTEWAYSPNYEWVDYNCDPTASSLHLSVE